MSWIAVLFISGVLDMELQISIRVATKRSAITKTNAKAKTMHRPPSSHGFLSTQVGALAMLRVLLLIGTPAGFPDCTV